MIRGALSAEVDLLLIAGSGRSGSTLLEQLLAERLRGLAVGELRFFFGYYNRGDIPCACGALLPECSFWAPIGRRLREEFDFVRLEQKRRRYARMRSLLLPGAVRRATHPESELVHGYRELYRLVIKSAGGRVVIDSSKIPTHVAVLKTIFHDQVACIHLVRDPRAVAWAFSRRVKRDPASPQRGGLMLRRRSLSALAIWALENAWTLRLLRDSDRHALIRYEDLVRTPRRTIEDVVSKHCSGHTASPRLALHSVGGNPVRFDTGPRMIREDREWADSSTRAYRLLAGLAVYPLLQVFGYPLEVEL